MKTIFSLLLARNLLSLLLRTVEMFITHFNTHWQMMTPLLYCTCMLVCSGITPSVNSRKYCIYCIGNVILTK